MDTPTILVNVNHVSKSFPGNALPAIQDLSIELHRGNITGVVGPDGAGKTTLLRLMAALMKPDQGSIVVAGYDSVQEATQVHNLLGYMPQKFGLYEDLSVIENLNLYADLRDVKGERRKEKFVKLLTFTNLTDFQNRLARNLSGGMKQKLGLACALLGDPQLLILDEPSVGVDPISRRELWAMMQDLIANNIAVVWATSYLDEAAKCDHVILLNEGKSLFNGKPDDLLAVVKNSTYKVDDLPHENKRRYLAKIANINHVIDSTIQGDCVRIVVADAEYDDDVTTALKNMGMHNVAVEPRFEDGYIKMLGGFKESESQLAKQLNIIKSDIENVIQAEHLTKKYGNFTAVNDLNFSIKRGEVFGLLGPNGAGKSTTFKMLCGLLIPTNGKASVMGLDLQTSSSVARNRIGYMAQKFSLYGNLDGMQNLKFFSGVYGLNKAEQKKQINMMIEIFDLHEYLKEKTNNLPLGIKQRLALACAVMHKPDILFLDEPTSGVDPITRREFWLHINGMVEKGMTVMVTTHFMEEAEYCDRIALIYRGDNIAQGSPDELKRLAKTQECTNPEMEDAFIYLVNKHDYELTQQKDSAS